MDFPATLLGSLRSLMSTYMGLLLGGLVLTAMPPTGSSGRACGYAETTKLSVVYYLVLGVFIFTAGFVLLSVTRLIIQRDVEGFFRSCSSRNGFGWLLRGCLVISFTGVWLGLLFSILFLLGVLQIRIGTPCMCLSPIPDALFMSVILVSSIVILVSLLVFAYFAATCQGRPRLQD